MRSLSPQELQQKQMTHVCILDLFNILLAKLETSYLEQMCRKHCRSSERSL